MTREEARKVFLSRGYIKVKGGSIFDANKWRESCRVVSEWLEQESCEDMGEVSDGYHTFNQLYHQRAVLFATIVNNFKHLSWKSLKHEDGKYCFDSNGKWFIVGIDTPKGSYTYHYETDKYWDMFNCEVLKCGKPWDGHTEKDVTRLLSLEQEPCDDVVSRGVFEQIMWERDVAIAQLKELGYGLGEKPKIGHWIFEGNQCFSCSSCGRIYTQKVFEYLKLHKDDSDFPNNCPNCGCKMIELQESEVNNG